MESVVIRGLPDDENDWQRRIILLTYEDGTTESIPGSLFEASELAFIHGLTLAPNPDGAFRCARFPQTWDQV
ncbi:MAG: hypothetical protein P4L20_06585 [Acidimicrobiales bacterium]|nr:hypothetical protein [Acidimicrobiales bacterium]